MIEQSLNPAADSLSFSRSYAVRELVIATLILVRLGCWRIRYYTRVHGRMSVKYPDHHLSRFQDVDRAAEVDPSRGESLAYAA
jgi:hypothetical protein